MVAAERLVNTTRRFIRYLLGAAERLRAERVAERFADAVCALDFVLKARTTAPVQTRSGNFSFR